MIEQKSSSETIIRKNRKKRSYKPLNLAYHYNTIERPSRPLPPVNTIFARPSWFDESDVMSLATGRK